MKGKFGNLGRVVPPCGLALRAPTTFFRGFPPSSAKRLGRVSPARRARNLAKMTTDFTDSTDGILLPSFLPLSVSSVPSVVQLFGLEISGQSRSVTVGNGVVWFAAKQEPAREHPIGAQKRLTLPELCKCLFMSNLHEYECSGRQSLSKSVKVMASLQSASRRRVCLCALCFALSWIRGRNIGLNRTTFETFFYAPIRLAPVTPGQAGSNRPAQDWTGSHSSKNEPNHLTIKDLQYNRDLGRSKSVKPGQTNPLALTTAQTESCFL